MPTILMVYLGWEGIRSAERANELAQKVGLEGRLNHRPDQYIERVIFLKF